MKKLFTSVMLMMFGIIGMNAQGIFALQEGDAGVASGTTVTSVDNITMTWGVTGGDPFKGGNKANNALQDLLGATAYCEGNGQNGKLSNGAYSGTVYLFAPVKAGTLTVGIVLNGGKSFFVKEGTDDTDVAFKLTTADGTEVTLDSDHKSADKITGGIVTFDVEAGKTYAVFCTGSKLGFYGFKYEVKATDATANAVFDFQNNPTNWPTSADTWSDETGKVTTLTVNDVVLTSIQGESFYPNIILKDEGHGTVFNVRKNASFKLAAPEGKALVKIAVTMWNSTSFDLTPSTGAVAENVWEGNATEVTFASAGNRYIAKIDVTLADENEETVKPAVVTEVEVADIATFNAIEDGTTVKLTLTNARVNGTMQGAYYVEDATGATVIKGIDLTVGKLLNGYLVGVKSTDANIDFINNPAVAVEYQLTATDASTFEATDAQMTGTEMSITDACAQANYGKLVTLKNVAISGGGQNKTLTDANGNTMKARDYMGVLPSDFTWPEKASITGVVIYYMTGWFILPISADAIGETTTGISLPQPIQKEGSLYNLQGVRQQQLKKGLNIVNGRKVVY